VTRTGMPQNKVLSAMQEAIVYKKLYRS